MIVVAAQAGRRAGEEPVAEDGDHLERDVGRAGDDDDAREEPVGREPHHLAAEAGDEPEVGEDRTGEERRLQPLVVGADDQRRKRERHVEVAERRQRLPRHAREATSFVP